MINYYLVLLMIFSPLIIIAAAIVLVFLFLRPDKEQADIFRHDDDRRAK